MRLVSIWLRVETGEKSVAIVVYLDVPTYGLGDVYFAHKIAEMLQRKYPAPQQVIKIYQCNRNVDREAHLKRLGFIAKADWLHTRPIDFELDMVVECPMYGQSSLDWLVDLEDMPPHLMISEYSWDASVGKVCSERLRPIKLKTGFAHDEIGVIAAPRAELSGAGVGGAIAEEKQPYDDSVGVSYCKGHVGRLRYTVNHFKHMLARREKIAIQLAFGNRSSVPNCLEYLGPFFEKHGYRTKEFLISDYGIDNTSSFEEIVETLNDIKRSVREESDCLQYITILMPSLPTDIFKQLRAYAGSVEADTGDQSFIEGLEAGKVICYEAPIETIGTRNFSHKADLRRLYLECMKEALSADAYRLLQLVNVSDEDIISSVDDMTLVDYFSRVELMDEISAANKILVAKHDLSKELFQVTDEWLLPANVRIALNTISDEALLSVVQGFLDELNAVFPVSRVSACRLIAGGNRAAIRRFIARVQRLCDHGLVEDLRDQLPQALRRLENDLRDHSGDKQLQTIKSLVKENLLQLTNKISRLKSGSV
ncbi:MAG: hypothetical protein P1U34_11250 [Coxiellaceae bacterium]|nr:hypothetical protein [Coxiellaceae bacterium]